MTQRVTDEHLAWLLRPGEWTGAAREIPDLAADLLDARAEVERLKAAEDDRDRYREALENLLSAVHRAEHDESWRIDERRWHEDPGCRCNDCAIYDAVQMARLALGVEP